MHSLQISECFDKSCNPMGPSEKGNKQNMLCGTTVERWAIGVEYSVLLESISVGETGVLE
jgi:hypothetical protein